jgi:ATP-dependent DNA helicase PIF1
VIGSGDDSQIGPVVKNGNRADTVRASIITHPLFQKFEIFQFQKNLRLLGIERSLNLDHPDDLSYFNHQVEYANILEQIRVGDSFSENVQQVHSDPKTGSTLVRLPKCKFITNVDSALRFLYPDGFRTPDLHKRAILCARNEDVDEWNKIVQDMNPNQPVALVARNEFKDIDDPKGILKSMLTEDACAFYRSNGVPEHRLILKKGDLCFVMRTLNRKEKLANNTRVVIKDIYKYSIRVQTLDEYPREFVIPRIKFNIKLKFGGFVLTRTQFPLRLAYAMTKNKSQGQSIPYSLNDIRNSPFSHGHLYVSMSRATDAHFACFFCNENQIEEEAVIVDNVVYPELLLPR